VTPVKPKSELPVKSQAPLEERIRNLGADLSKFAGKLDASDVVNDVFQKQPSISRQLDVIVVAPNIGK
jgi:hypothetical protein